MEGELEIVLAAQHRERAPDDGGNLALGDFAAGAIAGMAGVIAGQPLDTLRVRLQQRGCKARGAAGAWRAMAASEGGARALFRGMSYPLATAALQNAITFQAQRAGERALAGADSAPGAPRGTSLAATCAAGMLAGAAQTAVSAPVELLKIRQQLQTAPPGAPGYLGPLGVLRRLLREEGARGLARGFGVTLVRDTPSYGLYFISYALACGGLEALAARVRAAAPAAAPLPAAAAAAAAATAEPLLLVQAPAGAADGPAAVAEAGGASPAVQFLAGGFAGALAWLSVYPVDVGAARPCQCVHECRSKGRRGRGALLPTRAL